MDLLRKTYKKHGDGFSKARFWHIKHDDSWRKAKQVFQKTSTGWELAHLPEGAIEINITLTVEAGVHTSLSLRQLASEQTSYSEDLLSIYPFSIILNINSSAVILGERNGEDDYSPALYIANFGEGTTVLINNYGTIAGRGGKGGRGYSPLRAALNDSKGPLHWNEIHGVHGENGGTAIEIQDTNVSVHNHGQIWGGGGGGAAGLPMVRAYMNYIEQTGGPFLVALGGSTTQGGLNGTPIREGWMVMDFGNGGAGGGGAPYGEAGDFDEFSSISEFPLEKILKDYRIMSLALDQSVLTPQCFETEKVQKFKINGLVADTLGSRTYYEEDASEPKPAVEDDEYAGVLTTKTQNLENYSWNVNGTWFGLYWPSRPFSQDFVTKAITVKGSTVFSNNARNASVSTDGASAAGLEGGGAGATNSFSAGKPTIEDFKGNYQGGDDCTVLLNSSVDGSSANSVFGSYSNGVAGGGCGKRGGNYNYLGQTVSSPYGGDLIDIPAISITSISSLRGGYAGKALDYDSSSAVSYNAHGSAIIRGSDYP